MPEIKRDSNIDYRFKLIYAVGIVLVVAGHCRGGGLFVPDEWLSPFSYHLSLFAFSSGYFYKSSSEDRPLRFVWKKIKKLIIPIYLWNFFYALLVTVSSNKGFEIGVGVTLEKLFLLPITSGHQFVYNLGGWFVVPLFMVEVFSLIIRRLFSFICNRSIKELCLFTLQVLLGITGIYLASIGYNTGGWLVLARMLYFLPFYSLGTFYKICLEKYDRADNFTYFAVILLLQLIILLICHDAPEYTPSWCNNFDDGPILPIIEGFLGIFLWLRIAKILEPEVIKSKAVNLIADNTFSIMINQFLGFMLLKAVFGVMSRFSSSFMDFDWARYKTDINYYFKPTDMEQFMIFYLIAGIAVPIVLQLFLNFAEDKIRQHLHRFIRIQSNKE